MTKKSHPPNKFLKKLTRPRNRPLVIAHRGASSHAPENTREAIALGHAVGADACEIDVQLTRDNQVVVIHDDSLKRTTDVAKRFEGDPRGSTGYRVRSFDLDEIRALDAGSWFLSDPPRYRGAAHFGTEDRIGHEDRLAYSSRKVQVPTLVEVLDLIQNLDWLVNVEIKVDLVNEGFVLLELVLKEILERKVEDRVLISSFDASVVAEVSRRNLPVATGVLSAKAVADPRRFVREVVGADAFHSSVESLGAPAAPGVPVLVYTVNDATAGGLADRLAAWPVDGIFTDDPAALRARFDEGD